MGIVPVAPRRRRLLFEGDKREKGFNEKLDAKGLSRRESTYIPRLT